MTSTSPDRPRVVGVLGGMGPEATVQLMRRVIARTRAEDDCDHAPLIVDQNTLTPSRIRFLLEGGGEDPAPTLAAMARRLEAAGAEALAMPCNTAHLYLDAIRGASALPVLDMVERAADRVAAAAAAGPGGRVGLLASSAVLKTGLYGPPLAARGLTVLTPPSQARLMAGVRALKRDPASAEAAAALRAATAELVEAGVDALLLACTELSLIPEACAPGAPAVDALEVLAEEIVRFSRGPASLRPETETCASPI